MIQWEIEYSVNCLTEHVQDLKEIVLHINPQNDTWLPATEVYRLRDVLVDSIAQIEMLKMAVAAVKPFDTKKHRFWKRWK